MASQVLWFITIFSCIGIPCVVPHPEITGELLGDLEPETALGANTTCPSYLVEMVKHRSAVCGGAVLTDSMMITSCECIGRQYMKKTLRDKPESFKVKSKTKLMQVHSIILHPLCQTGGDLTSHGTGTVKVDGHLKFSEKLKPLALYTSNGKSLLTHFNRLFTEADLRCTAVALSSSLAAKKIQPKCKYHAVVTVEMRLKFLKSDACEVLCTEFHAASCSNLMVERDLFCAELVYEDASSCDFVPGFPLVCEDSIWGVIPYIDECLPNMIFFYGIRSVAEMYNLALKFSALSPQGDDSGGGDTSGYASDSADFAMTEPPWKPTNWSHPTYGLRRTPESFSSGSGGREERAKWGERGVGVGHLWSPSVHLPGNLLPQIEPTTPSWIQRGLQEPAQVLVIAHDESLPGSLANSHDMSRSTDTLSTTEEYQRCFLRGQNIPIDPHIAAEKERKRQKAIEHQNAIKQQLEEKEIKKRKEQERIAREEMLEEERLKRHHEIELLRLEEEKRRQKEKEEKDERVAKALREAIEIAEKKAKEERARARRKHIADRQSPQPVVEQSSAMCGQQRTSCGSANQNSTLRLESTQSNLEVMESLMVPCQKSNEILVYHTEVVMKSPPPLKTPEIRVERDTPEPVISRRPLTASEKSYDRRSSRVRRSPELRQSPKPDESSINKSELDFVPQRDPPLDRLTADFVETKLDLEGRQSDLKSEKMLSAAEEANSREAKEPDKGESERSTIKNDSDKAKPATERVHRAVSPLIIPVPQSTSPSQDPPPPPRNTSEGKKPPSDAPANPNEDEETAERTSPKIRESRQSYPPLPGSPDLDDILTVAVRDFNLEESEVEASRLCVIPSPTHVRLLTPTLLRGGLYRSEVGTQTETRSSRLTRRTQRLEDRPKWGVNRPSTRFIKASDRYPFSRNRNDTDDSRSPSPMNNRKSTSYTNFLPMARLRNSSVESTKPRKESKAINTPRLIQIMPKPGIVRKNSASRRYLSFKGTPRLTNRPQGNSVLPKKLDLTELITVKDVLSQLTSLKYGLRMKQKEWDLSRSQTPFSEVSSIG
ncbi:hypothetical protein GE061_003472 [Apolygus lucorum]|uniref:CCDC66 domain-containing protein n=1 Tax=Apolygus lucorum TaxID=248454 RepID=A0A8S9X3N5_APOLU|nr:hypothetical protein GE061_003472 [Apolygus lucorum]